jgi:small-conductance mechanosensitive channel
MSDIYCGYRDVPKNKRRGSMRECAEAGKISYYGVKKIDSKTLEVAKTKKTSKKNMAEKMKIKLITVKAEIKGMKNKQKTIKDPKKKKEADQIIDKKQKEFDKLLKEFENYEKEMKKTKKSKK